MTAEEKFTDQQMALILKRAAELQATGDEPAHSLESIQQIAGQVGIDPKLVADVAATLDQPRGGSSLLGAPSDFRLTRRVERSQAIDRHRQRLRRLIDALSDQLDKPRSD